MIEAGGFRLKPRYKQSFIDRADSAPTRTDAAAGVARDEDGVSAKRILAERDSTSSAATADIFEVPNGKRRRTTYDAQSVKSNRAVTPPDQLAKLEGLRKAGFTQAQLDKCARTMSIQAQIPAVNLDEEAVTKLANKNYDQVQPNKGRQFHLIMGNSGSGKSFYIADKLVADHNARLLDADHIKPQIPGYADGLGNQAVHRASTDVVSEMLVRSMHAGDNIVHSMCGTDVPSVAKKIDAAKSLGYDVHLHLADIPAEESARRVFARGFGAPSDRPIRQMIPPSYPLSVGDKPVHVFNELTARPDYLASYRHLNTNVPYGAPARVVRESGGP